MKAGQWDHVGLVRCVGRHRWGLVPDSHWGKESRLWNGVRERGWLLCRWQSQGHSISLGWVCQDMDVFLLAKDTCGPNGKEMLGGYLGLYILGLPGGIGWSQRQESQCPGAGEGFPSGHPEQNQRCLEGGNWRRGVRSREPLRSSSKSPRTGKSTWILYLSHPEISTWTIWLWSNKELSHYLIPTPPKSFTLTGDNKANKLGAGLWDREQKSHIPS